MAPRSSSKTEAWIFYDNIVVGAAPEGIHGSPWVISPDGALGFRPDYEPLKRMLGVPLYLKGGTQSGVPALALDVWLNFELRRAGF